MRVVYLIWLFCLSLAVQGQKKETVSRINIKPSFTIGVLEGKSASAVQLNGGVGLKYKTNQLGVGVGIDEYYLRSIPLYFDGRKYILPAESTPFVYGFVGTNLPWLKEIQKNSFTTTQRGLFYDVGIGYQLPIMYKHQLSISAGYSYKEISQEQNIPIFCITWPCPEQRQYFQYQLRRLSLKAGINF
ncbi:MAG: hypothetical protein ACM3VS_14160 [Candidatus Dadabacteria bacterium]